MGDAQKIADILQGTSLSLTAVLEDHGLEHLETNDDFCFELDELIFECVVCGWWCEISEESSDDHGLTEWTCLECCESL